MQHITEQMLANAIAPQPDDFVTHDIIRFLYTNYQHEYLDELNNHGNAQRPFTETHRQIGQALSRLRDLIRKAGRVPSVKTLRGKATMVQKWQKLTAHVPEAATTRNRGTAAARVRRPPCAQTRP